MSAQLDLTSWAPKGATAEAIDVPRLGKQLQAVFALMSDGAWHTLAEIAAVTGAPEASASARLRDMRRMGRSVARRRRGDPKHGLFEYRLKVPP
jgi:hypothetical protein